MKTAQDKSKLTSRKLLKMDSPLTLDSPSSNRLKRTMTASKQFHLSLTYLIIPSAIIFKVTSAVNIAVKTCVEKMSVVNGVSERG